MIRIGFLMMALIAITGCSNQSDQMAKDFSDIQRYKDSAPAELLKDPNLSTYFRALVPQEKFKCLNEMLNYAPDLSLNADGSISTSLLGSRADEWRIFFLSASPKGLIHILMTCTEVSTEVKQYEVYTNSDGLSTSSQGYQDFLFTYPETDAVVTISNGTSMNQTTMADYTRSIAAKDAKDIQIAERESSKQSQTDMNQQQTKETSPVDAPTNSSTLQQNSQQSDDAFAIRVADALAVDLAGNPYEECSHLVSKVRTTAYSNYPPYLKLRQIEIMIDKAPRVCLRDLRTNRGNPNY